MSLFLIFVSVLIKKLSIFISFQRFIKTIFFKNYILGLVFKATVSLYMYVCMYACTYVCVYVCVCVYIYQTNPVPLHLAAAISTGITTAHTRKNLPMHNDIHSSRLNVIQQPSRASQSKTSHTATKKNFWLLAQLFPYQSTKSTSSLLLSISNAWASVFEAIRTRSV